MSDTMSQDLRTRAPSEHAFVARSDAETAGVPPQPSAASPAVGRKTVSAVAISAGRREPRPDDEAPSVWGGVPLRNPDFIGRDEPLDRLAARLRGETTSVLPSALHGMGGVGKSQLAVEHIYRHLQDYDLVWWIDATNAEQIGKRLTELAGLLGLPGAGEVRTAVPAVREALRLGRPYRRWLLVFDSAEDPELIRPFLPGGGPGQILVTTRRPGWNGVARPLEVEVFPRDESKELLALRHPGLTDEDSGLIAAKLADLPLAIAQVGAWLAETGMSAQEYLRLFDENVTEVLDTSAPGDYGVTVAAAWNPAFDELKTQSPAAYQLLEVCAFFGLEPISRNLFTGVRRVSIAPELDAALHNPMRLNGAIREINRYGLVKIDQGGNTLQLHRLVQLVLRDRMTGRHRLQMRRGAQLLLANSDPRDPASPATWPSYEKILPHCDDAELVDCSDVWVRKLVLNLSDFLHHWGDHQGALALAERAVEAWASDRKQRQARGEAPIEAPLMELGASARLAYFLWVAGRYGEADQVAKQTLSRYTEELGPEYEETLSAQLTCALMLKARGDFLEARRWNEETHSKAHRLFGGSSTTLGAAHDLVVALLLTGDYAQARTLAENTVERRTKTLGADHGNTIGTQVALALARRELGHYQWARIELTAIAERVERLYGPDRAGTLRRRHHQSVACRKDGAHDAALELSGEALRRFRMRYGDKHPDTMACALAHSIDLRHAREFTEARMLGVEVHQFYRETLGESHPHTLAAAVDLGVTLRANGNPSGARALDERSLELFGEKLGEDHPHTIACGIDVANDLAALDRADEAAALDAVLLERARRVLGEDHPTTLAVQLNRSLDLRALGEIVQADELYEDVLTRYRLTLSAEHPATRAAERRERADCDIDPLPL
ncbi:FxSxx-COOH system tetratricopeptide repeat protein [Amycolatopsis sp. cmx-4-68]|uniref:FxSxx-COOH system tetratricopeptide repeat protein n=1 Tax=Amycolatopsis sp. cmx-4-68 TaxID=2790938 RepID=UPI003978BC52